MPVSFSKYSGARGVNCTCAIELFSSPWINSFARSFIVFKSEPSSTSLRFNSFKSYILSIWDLFIFESTITESLPSTSSRPVTTPSPSIKSPLFISAGIEEAFKTLSKSFVKSPFCFCTLLRAVYSIASFLSAEKSLSDKSFFVQYVFILSIKQVLFS